MIQKESLSDAQQKALFLPHVVMLKPKTALK